MNGRTHSTGISEQSLSSVLRSSTFLTALQPVVVQSFFFQFLIQFVAQLIMNILSVSIFTLLASYLIACAIAIIAACRLRQQQQKSK